MNCRLEGSLATMSLDKLDRDEVIALRFEDPSFADELASWCDGGVIGATITVPVGSGMPPAVVGDWVVRDAQGRFEVLLHETFVLRFGPVKA